MLGGHGLASLDPDIFYNILDTMQDLSLGYFGMGNNFRQSF